MDLHLDLVRALYQRRPRKWPLVEYHKEERDVEYEEKDVQRRARRPQHALAERHLVNVQGQGG